jgi:hypothetical protein
MGGDTSEFLLVLSGFVAYLFNCFPLERIVILLDFNLPSEIVAAIFTMVLFICLSDSGVSLISLQLKWMFTGVIADDNLSNAFP